MPWTVADVSSKTKKAKTQAQKKKWVSIANSVLKSCQDEGGTDCEGRAIRIANSKFSEEQKMRKLPKGALRFVEVGGGTGAFAVGEDGAPKKLKMTLYSGGVIKEHWYWDNLAIDLSGMKKPKGNFPVLEEHMQSKKIAFSKDPIIDKNGLTLDSDKTKFVSTPESDEFQRLSSEGFPYQASMYAKPLIVERIEEGASTEVNGFSLKGPATIWRQSELKEASICVFGWDDKTKAEAFSKEIEEEVEYKEHGLESAEDDEQALSDNEGNQTEEEVNESMDINEMKEKHPELLKEIQDAAIAGVESKFSTDIVALKEANTKLSAKVLAGEKAEAIRHENDLKTQADTIWNDKLAASDIPEHLYEKVRPHVSHVKFVEESILNVEKFSEAVDAEIKDWSERGATKSVMGAGFHSKEVDDSETQKFAKQQKSDDDQTNDLLSRAGQETQDQT